jgi:VIT1/CCC1 family predicted Fe2+/Mn2+ transporter
MSKLKDSLIFQIKQIVFGIQDGLVTTIILTTTLAYVSDTRILIISALTAGVGGAISMATGTYLGAKTQKDVLEIKSKNSKEMSEILIEQELTEDKLKKSDIKKFMEIIKDYPEFGKKIASNLILGIDIDKIVSPIIDAIFMGASFLIGAIIPTLPYIFLKVPIALPLSIILSALTLLIIGLVKTVEKGQSRIKNGLEIMIIGMIAALLGYLIGRIF